VSLIIVPNPLKGGMKTAARDRLEKEDSL
jgi:hypothetical protein